MPSQKCLYKREVKGESTSRKECNMKTEAEIEEMELQTKEYQQLSDTTRGKKSVFP